MPKADPLLAADMNLLFGILAMQMDFVTRDQLVAAMNAWVLNKSKALGAILVEQKALAAERHVLLQALMREHLKQHQNDPQRSLAAVSSVGSVRQDLEKIADADVQASLVPLAVAGRGRDPYATCAPSMGTPTSSGLRFRILRPHARGGLGEVFVANDEELHRQVALKEIQNKHADDPQSRSRFILEAEITGGLEHPGIVPVYGLGQYADGRPFYAMRFIRGDSLQDAIQKYHKPQSEEPLGARSGSQSSLELRQLLGRFIDVCDAIQYAHDRGVLHRDLKPGNIMLGKYGETLVVDWGLAKAKGEPTAETASAAGVERSATLADEPALQPRSSASSSETQAGSAVGTPQYMSPEQAAGRLDLLGPASDVYSLGATLYCVLTGQAPFQDKEISVVLGKVQRGDFPAPRQIKPDIPRALEAVCLKAMATADRQRYVSARALADDVEHWLADEPVTAWSEPWTIRAARWRRRHKTIIAVLSVALLLTVAGSVALLFLEQRRWHQQRENTNNLQKSAENEDQLASSEIAAGRFSSAEAILQQACDRLLPEPSLEPLRSNLQTRQERVHRLVQFYLHANNLERFIFEEKVAEGLTAGEAALSTLEIARHDDWWQHLPDADLSGPQREHLRNEAYRQIILVSALRSSHAFSLPNEPAAATSALDLLARAERYRPSHSARLLQLALTAAGKEDARDPPPAEPTGAIDHYFLGFIHWAMILRPDNPFVKRLLSSHTPLLDFKTPLATAEEHFRTAIDLQPQHPFTYLFLANTLLRARRYQEAEFAASGSIGLRPDFEVGYLMRAMAAFRQSSLPTDPRRKKRLLESTMADLDQAIRLNPEYGEAYHLRAVVHESMKAHDKAIGDYTRVIQLLPKRAEAYQSRGFIYYSQKQFDQAIADYDEAIRLAPRSFVYNNRGVAFYFKKAYVKALADLDEAIRLDPKLANPFNHRGKTYRALGKPELAMADWQEAIRLNPKYAEPYANLAWLRATYPDKSVRDGKMATEYAARACELTDWKEPHYLAILAAAQAAAGQFADAVQRQREALALSASFTKEELAAEQLRLKLFEEGMPFVETAP